MARMAGMYGPKSDIVYMETVYPVLRQVPLVLNFLGPVCLQLFLNLFSFKFEPKWLLAVLLMLQSTLFFSAACSAYCFCISSCTDVTSSCGERLG